MELKFLFYDNFLSLCNPNFTQDDIRQKHFFPEKIYITYVQNLLIKFPLYKYRLMYSLLIHSTQITCIQHGPLVSVDFNQASDFLRKGSCFERPTKPHIHVGYLNSILVIFHIHVPEQRKTDFLLCCGFKNILTRPQK